MKIYMNKHEFCWGIIIQVTGKNLIFQNREWLCNLYLFKRIFSTNRVVISKGHRKMLLDLRACIFPVFRKMLLNIYQFFLERQTYRKILYILIHSLSGHKGQS